MQFNTKIFKKPNTNLFAARCEGNETVFEVSYDTIKVTDVTLKFIREDNPVASIYNDYNTDRTMAHIYSEGETDFASHRVPKQFVYEVLSHAEAHDIVSNPSRVYGYRQRILQE